MSTCKSWLYRKSESQERHGTAWNDTVDRIQHFAIETYSLANMMKYNGRVTGWDKQPVWIQTRLGFFYVTVAFNDNLSAFRSY